MGFLIRCEDDLHRGLAELRRVDPGFCTVIDKAGPVPLRDGKPGYEGLASIIVSQMVSKAAADTVWARLEGAIGAVTPEAIVTTPVETIRAAGLSGGKEAALRRVAEHVLDGSLDLDAVAFMPEREALGTLTAIKGLGPWTAEVYLLFCGGHPDIFPAGDIALMNACAHALNLPQRPEGKAFRVLAERWQPYRSLAARVLWAYYATEMRREATPL